MRAPKRGLSNKWPERPVTAKVPHNQIDFSISEKSSLKAKNRNMYTKYTQIYTPNFFINTPSDICA